MIYLIGLGLDDKEITAKGLEALGKVDEIYAEFYTNTKTMNLERIENEIDKEIQVLERNDVEQKDVILEKGKDRDVAFLVSGDPLTATTHYDIKDRAENQDIEVKICHAPSIFTSVSETGLSIYKFGRTVTLPKDAQPQSIVEYINGNDSIGLHTLILLDIDYPASKASEKLIEMNSDLTDRKAIIVERANSEDQEITLTNLENATDTDFGPTPHCIVLIGDTSHLEEDFIGNLKST